MINIRSPFIGGVSYALFTFLLALYFTIVLNIPVYKELTSILNSLEFVKLGFVLSIPVFFLSAINFLFNLFSWPYLIKPFFISLVIVSSLVSYAGFNYGVMFDYGMIENVIETDSSEASSYLSLYSCTWVLLLGLLPSYAIYKVRFKPITSVLKFITEKLASMILSLVAIGIIAAGYYQDYASVGRNNSHLRKLIIPTQFVYSTVGYVKEKYFTVPIPYRFIGVDAQQSNKALSAANEKPNLVVLVVGETARTQNYELNGYEKPTNAYTRDLGVISYKDVEACGTATAVSVPCMFSNFTRDNFDRKRADNQDNVLDILKRAGVSLLWKENDGGDKDVAKHINKFEIDRSRKDELCNGNTCYDMALLEGFEEDVLTMSGNRLITLHLIGSHGPTYFQRYPKNMAKFLPDCPRADIENCSIDELVNTYDNTILYTDYVIAQTISKLQKLEDRYNTALIYISDHGESLGENGLFLHGMPYSLAPAYQTKVPLMVWMSPNFSDEKSVNINCMKANSELKELYSQDYIFHSLLGVMDVETKAYDHNLDLFATCRES